MTDFTKKKFSVAVGSAAYRNNYERTFMKPSRVVIDLFLDRDDEGEGAGHVTVISNRYDTSEGPVFEDVTAFRGDEELALTESELDFVTEALVGRYIDEDDGFADRGDE